MTIKCTCPANTVRLEMDLELDVVDGVPTYLHKPCIRPPTKIEQAYPMDNTGKSSTNLPEMDRTATAAGKTNFERLAAKMLGPEATAEQRLKLKHFTSEFHCDGPCRGSTKIDDYLLCKKCCAWQHKNCMLYGEEGDVGRPVCNRCFMISLARRGNTVRWQRKQLVQAVQEAWMFFKDPTNRHQAWRRAYARRFLAAFFLKVSQNISLRVAKAY